MTTGPEAAPITANAATDGIIWPQLRPEERMPKRNGTGIELLADPIRRQIIGALAIRPRRPSSLAKEIGLSRPATTRQLHLLLDAELVHAGRSSADRRAVLYAIEPRRHGVVTAWLAGTEIGRPTTSDRERSYRPSHELIERDPSRPDPELHSPDPEGPSPDPATRSSPCD